MRPKVLCVGHGTIERNSGGVEVYQRIIAERLAPQFEFLFFAPDLHSNEKGNYLLYSLESDLRENYRPSPQVRADHFSHPDLERILLGITKEHRISLVHFHHLIRQVPNLILACNSRGIPTVFSVHDYYAICDEYNLLNFEGRYCGVFENGFQKCDSCLYLKARHKFGSQKLRHEKFSEALLATDRLIFNTEGGRSNLKGIFPLLEDSKLRVVGAPSGTKFKSADQRPQDGPLRVLIPNGLSRLKGGETLRELVRLTQGMPIEYHFFGKSEREFSEEEIRVLNDQVHFHGHYTREFLSEFSSSIHLSIHASIWPETFCISLSEMWDLGVVPIASNIGALSERIRDGENGFLVPPGDSQQLKELLALLLKDRTKIERIRAGFQAPLGTSAEECSIQIRQLYEEVLKSRPPPKSTPQSMTAPGSWSTGRGPKSQWLRRKMIGFLK